MKRIRLSGAQIAALADFLDALGQWRDDPEHPDFENEAISIAQFMEDGFDLSAHVEWVEKPAQRPVLAVIKGGRA